MLKGDTGGVMGAWCEERLELTYQLSSSSSFISLFKNVFGVDAFFGCTAPEHWKSSGFPVRGAVLPGDARLQLPAAEPLR